MFAVVPFEDRLALLVRVVAVAAVLPACKGRSSHRTAPQADSAAQPAKERRAEFEIYAFAEVVGTIAPCGCTTEPLGGVQFAFGTIEASGRPKQRLVLEPGSFLFPHRGGPLWPEDEAGWEQAHQRAAVLQGRFSALGDHLVSGIGPSDLGSPQGREALDRYPMPRVAANVPGLGFSAHAIVPLESEGLTWRVGVTTVVDPSLPGAEALGTIDAPAPVLASTLAAMREAGSQLSIVLAHGRRPFAERLAQDVEGIDVVVVGVPEGVETERLGSPPVHQGSTLVLEPGTQLQTLSVLRLSVRADLAAVPSPAEWTLAPSVEALQQELTRLQERLAKFEADPSADAAYLGTLRKERDRLTAALRGESAVGPVTATLEQRKVTCRLPVDAPGARALATYEAGVAAQNEQRFRGVKAPAPAPGKPGYTGTQGCVDCHAEAVEFWETTRHAAAYATLVDGNKQYDLTCVGCHVTGYREPGGSEVVENAGLRDVQCEVCHGPGSLHVEDAGEDLSLIERDAPAQLCATECHTPEHSDTFEYEAYLRDILGPGHGEAKRQQLGAGPTGRALREAGLAAAGGSCKEKMMAH